MQMSSRWQEIRSWGNIIVRILLVQEGNNARTMPGARGRGRPRTAWIDNIKSWTGLSVEESVRMTDDRDKWRKYVHGVANPRIEDG